MIKLKESSQPYSLFTPRNIPIPLRPKVRTEFDHMQSLRVISPVHHPTPWCVGIIVVTKCSGAVRICVDLKPLNNDNSFDKLTSSPISEDDSSSQRVQEPARRIMTQ